ncbi:hypothetical protein DTO212C5_241 [Paecilomyces variotii]|nr:hypothetical protein DTO212C5_241 [Paecilomyces variotii]
MLRVLELSGQLLLLASPLAGAVHPSFPPAGIISKINKIISFLSTPIVGDAAFPAGLKSPIAAIDFH